MAIFTRKLFTAGTLVALCCLVAFAGTLRVAAQTVTENAVPTLRPKMLLIGIDGVYLKTIEEQRLPFLDLFVRTSAVATNAGSLYTLEESDLSLLDYNRFNWRSLLSGTWATEDSIAPSFVDQLEIAAPEKNTVVLSSWQEIPENLVTQADVARFTSSAQGSILASDYLLTAEAKQTLQSDDPDLMLLYFGSALSTLREVTFDVDHPRYLNALKELDTMLGEIITSINSRESYAQENWIVMLINTQYINRSGGPDQSPFKSFITANGRMISPAKPFSQPVRLVDIYPTVLTFLTGSFSGHPNLDGRVMDLFPVQETIASKEILESIQELAEKNDDSVERILKSQQESGSAVSSQTQQLIDNNMTALGQRIETMSHEWNTQRSEDLAAIQKSNQLIILIVVGLFAVTILAVLFSMMMQARTMRHLSTIVTSMPNSQRLLQAEQEDPMLSLDSPQVPPNKLLNTIGQLEKRIHELEDSLEDNDEKNSYPESHPELFEEKKSIY